MPNEFRFFLICQGAMQRLADRLVTLTGVVNELTAAAGERLELAAIVGAVLRPSMKGKCLDLMAWRLDRSGERQRIPDYAGTPLILPKALGPQVLPYQIAFQLPETESLYGFELFDREGVFGPREGLLATYMYSVAGPTGGDHS